MKRSQIQIGDLSDEHFHFVRVNDKPLLRLCCRLDEIKMSDCGYWPHVALRECMLSTEDFLVTKDNKIAIRHSPDEVSERDFTDRILLADDLDPSSFGRRGEGYDVKILPHKDGTVLKTNARAMGSEMTNGNEDSHQRLVRCFECDNGTYRTEYRDYPTTNGEGKPMICKNVPHEVCTICGDVVFSSEGSREIERLRKASGVVYRNSKANAQDELPPEGTL